MNNHSDTNALWLGVTWRVASELICDTEKQTESQIFAVCSWIKWFSKCRYENGPKGKKRDLFE